MKRFAIAGLIIVATASLASATVIDLGTEGIGPSYTAATAGVRAVNLRFVPQDGATTTITSGRPGGDLTYDYNVSPFGDLVDGGSAGATRSNIAYGLTDDPWIVMDENFTGAATTEGPIYGSAVDPNNPPSWAQKGIGSHANSGVTFDLDYFRDNATYGTTADQTFVLRGRSGANDFKRAGTVSTSILVDGVVQYVTPRLAWNQPGQPFEIALPANARYVTLGVTSGGDGIGAAHGVFENIALETVDSAPKTVFYRGDADAAADDGVAGIYWSDDPESLGKTLTGSFGTYGSPTHQGIFDPIAEVLQVGETYYLTVAVDNTGGPGGFRGTFRFDNAFRELAAGGTMLNTNLTNWMVSSTAPGPGTVWEAAWAAPVASGWYTGSDGVDSDAIWIWRDAGGGSYASGTVYLRAQLTAVPEPSTAAMLLGLGGLGLLGYLRRRKS